MPDVPTLADALRVPTSAIKVCTCPASHPLNATLAVAPEGTLTDDIQIP